MDVYGVFQGGGAKGYAHVGAYKAAERRDIRFSAVAGTSAGAIIASLISCGFTAEELWSEDRDRKPGILDLDPLSLIDQQDWATASRLRATISAIGGEGPWPAWLLVHKAAEVARIYGDVLGFNLTSRWERRAEAKAERRRAAKAEAALAPAPTSWLRASRAAFLLAQIFFFAHHPFQSRRLFRSFGLTGTQPLEVWLQQVMASKLGLPPDRLVTFSDLSIPLKVLATEVETGEPRVFGGEIDGSRLVARAVAASACFPFFFRPVEIDGKHYVDGGLSSNLPAWLFDEERAREGGFTPMFGFKLVDNPLQVPKPIAPTALWDFSRRLFNATRLGAASLEERSLHDYWPVELLAEIGTLSFGELATGAPALIEAGRQSVDRFFLETIGPQDPAKMARILRLLVSYLRPSAPLDVAGRVRAAVLLPTGKGFARVFYSAHMENDADDRLTVRTDGLGIGTCLKMKQPVLVRTATINWGRLPKGVDKYELNARPKDVVSAYAVPMFAETRDWRRAPKNRRTPLGALLVDADVDMSEMLLDHDKHDMLANFAQVVAGYLIEKGVVRSSHQTRLFDPPNGWLNLEPSGSFRVSSWVSRDAGDVPETSSLVEAIATDLRS